MASSRDILTLAPPGYDVKASYGADPFQFGYLRLPKSKGPHPLALVIHGGFWRAAYDLEHSGHMCAALTRAGVATWSLEYRRIGNPGGGWPGTFEDVAAGARHASELARKYDVDASRMVAIGHSAGGHLALWLAAANSIRLRGVVSLAGVADLRRAWEMRLSNNVVEQLMNATPAQKPGDYALASPADRVPLGVPTRILHGAADDIVPLEISASFEKAARKTGDDCRLAALPEADHFDLIDPRSAVWPVVERAVLELL